MHPSHNLKRGNKPSHPVSSTPLHCSPLLWYRCSPSSLHLTDQSPLSKSRAMSPRIPKILNHYLYPSLRLVFLACHKKTETSSSLIIQVNVNNHDDALGVGSLRPLRIFLPYSTIFYSIFPDINEICGGISPPQLNPMWSNLPNRPLRPELNWEAMTFYLPDSLEDPNKFHTKVALEDV